MIRQFIPESLHEYLDISFIGNTIEGYITALGAFILFLILFKIIREVILFRLHKLAEKTKTDIDDTVIKIIRSLKPPFYASLSFYLAIQFISLGSLADNILTTIIIIWVVYQVVVGTQILIDYVVRKKMGDSDGSADAAASFLSLVAKIVLWSVGLMFLLSNLGINVTSLIAALGVGGIAVAFALQNILGDLFSSFAIFFDKPFVPGDFIVVGDKMGTVLHVGMKTTRIRSLSGEEIVFPNAELTNSKIQNFKKMEERRVSLTVGITYDTPTEKLRKALEIIKSAIEEVEKTRFDRAHFKKFSDSSLDIEVVYYVESPEYVDYMDTNQKIHFEIKEQFEKEKIDFAYPTQTIYLEK